MDSKTGAKKSLIIFGIIWFVLILPIIYSLNNVQISRDVFDELNNTGKARIIVELKDPSKGIENIIPSALIKSSDKIDFQKKIIFNSAINKINKSRIINQFDSFFGFAMNADSSDISFLENNSNVKSIFLDKRISIDLSVSVPLIEGNDTWKMTPYGINITGKGESICLIDTGVDYTHPDLGGCNIYPLIFDGNNVTLSPLIESAHPYANNLNQTIKINYTGFDKIALHFVNLSLENGTYGDTGDRVIIYDSNFTEIASYGGYAGRRYDFWTPYSNSDTVYLRFVTDPSVGDYGYFIDKIKNGTTNESYNWTSCSKVVGGWDFVNNDGNPKDDQGHGTHCAGIAAANGTIKGVAINSNIVAVKALDSLGSGWTSDILYGMEFCINNKDKYNISVMSMSLGDNTGYYSYCDSIDTYYADVINNAVKNNISVVVAAGNNGWADRISSPACIKNATAVGGTTKSDVMYSGFNRNSLVDLVAPGVSITSTRNNGGSLTLSGTSMATPHVAGSFALISQFLKLQNKRTGTPDEIQNILNKSGKLIYDAGSSLYYSRVQLKHAILYANNITPNVSLKIPENNHINASLNMTFFCNGSDMWNITNMTFFLYNSSLDIIYNETKAVNDFNFDYNFTVNNLSYKYYLWECRAYDINNNINSKNNNTLILSSKLAKQYTPINNSILSISNDKISCESYFYDETALIKNLTLNIFDSNSTLVYNRTILVNEGFFIGNFSLNLLSNQNYTWNCIITDNNSQMSLSQYNYTFFYDNIAPYIINISDSSDTSSILINLNASENVNYSINYGNDFNLMNNVHNNNYYSNYSLLISGLNSSTNYYYNITLCDYSGNCITNGTYVLTTKTPITQVSGGGGGGTGDSAIKPSIENAIYNEKFTELYQKMIKSLSMNDEINFQLNDYDYHSLKISNVLDNSAEIIISSEPINFMLNSGEFKLINLSSTEFYDLKVYIASIKNKNATIELTRINQPILEKTKEIISPREKNEPVYKNATMQENSQMENPSQAPNILGKILIFGIISFIIFLILYFIISFHKNKKYKTKENLKKT